VSEPRAGFAALLGRPNAGKSTLLNALVGEKLAIVAARAQTTRGRLLGVLTRPGLQIALVDTPGVHRGQAIFNRAMNESALRAGREADVRCLLFECGASWDEPEERIAALPAPLVLVRTQRDRAEPSPVPGLERFAEVVEVSALTGQGLEALIAALARSLPLSPPLFDASYLTDRPLRFLAAEQIREVAFERLEQELPYALAVEVEEWRETDEDIRIRANLLVSRDSQKGIVVGAGGRMIRDLGTEARRRIAERLGKAVHLALWVKTDRDWIKRPKRARELGYLD
jgi:GTP-binding protein Era